MADTVPANEAQAREPDEIRVDYEDLTHAEWTKALHDLAMLVHNAGVVTGHWSEDPDVHRRRLVLLLDVTEEAWSRGLDEVAESR